MGSLLRLTDEPRGLKHCGGINPIADSIGGDELMETKPWDLLLQGECSGV